MNLFSFLSLLGGLALFLFGMNIMGEGLEKRAGGKLKTILEKLTSSPFRGLLLGLGVTAIIQSSSATTVMVVGFVNSGLMQLGQAIGVIMGANIGTTVTAWILSLTGLEGDSFIIKILKPSSFSPVLAIIGIGLHMFSKNSRHRDTGTIFLGFAILMYGMEAMSGAVKPLANEPAFTNILLWFSNPLLGVLAGMVLTAVIQSSSASVGILQALSSTGAITYGSAIPIIMGQNIGTCVTAMLSSIGTHKNARRAALVHLYFNLIGTGALLALFYGTHALVHFTFTSSSINQVGIAIVHTSFNLLSTLMLLPFTKVLERMACATIRDKDEKEDQFQALDERLLNTPTLAVAQSRDLCKSMGALARDSMISAMGLVSQYDEKKTEEVFTQEDQVDTYEDKLSTYLVKLSQKSLNHHDSLEVSKLLHCIVDFERISDHAVSIVRISREIHEKDVHFSEGALAELEVIRQAVTDICARTVEAFSSGHTSLATQIEPMEQVIDSLKAQLKKRHIHRLRKGQCTLETGLLFSDIITHYERVGDHCSNIGACLVEIAQGSFDTHAYLHSIKHNNNSGFLELVEEAQARYPLPPENED